MKFNRYEQRIHFHGEDGDKLEIGYDNRGDPYRQGVSLTLESDGRFQGSVFLEDREAKVLRDLLNKIYPQT